MILGYARVSPDQNLSLQADALRAAGCETVFADHGVGRRLPELERVLKRLRAGDVLVVTKLDRLGGGFNELIDLVKQIEERGAHLRSLADSIDTTTGDGRFVFQTMRMLAEFARGQRSERARSSMKAAKMRGQHLGRPPKLTPEQVRVAVERVNTAGEEPDDVARSFGVSPLTLSRAFDAHRKFERQPTRRRSA